MAEAVLRGDLLNSGGSVAAMYRLGDVLTVWGRLENRSGSRMSILVDRLEAAETWEAADVLADRDNPAFARRETH